jgi:transcriptional regulator with XRE-family HTH domain
VSSVPTALGEMPGGRGRGLGRGAPNSSGARLRWMRVDAGWSPGRLAARVRQAGRNLGKPNNCDSRMVLDWEYGGLIGCAPVYRAALTRVTGLRFDQLCSPWMQCPDTPATVDAAAVVTAGQGMRPLARVPFGMLLRGWRLERHLSQRALADLVQRFGESIGEPNACTMRLVQKWESGEHATVSSEYVSVLNKLTGIPAEVLNPPCAAFVPPSSVLELIDIFIATATEQGFNIVTDHGEVAGLLDWDQLYGWLR